MINQSIELIKLINKGRVRFGAADSAPPFWRRNGTAPSCPAPNRRRRNGLPPNKKGENVENSIAFRYYVKIQSLENIKHLKEI